MELDRARQSWLVTGGCGFIGRRLIARLLKLGVGHGVRVVDDLSVGSRAALARLADLSEIDPADAAPPRPAPGTCQLWVGDILDAELAQRVCRDIDVVVHLAANTGVGPSVTDPRGDCMSNVVGTFNYLEAARANAVRRFVFASSGAPVGEREPPLHEELAPRPVSPYGASKLAGEGYCSAYYRSFGLATVALRFGNVYGPGSDHKNSVVAKFIRQALAGETLEIYGDGGQTRDFIYIDDLIDALLAAAARPAEEVGGEVFQIATSRETSVAELLQLLLGLLGEAGVRPPSVVNAEPRVGDVRRNFSLTDKAQRLLGWRARTPLDDGLRAVLADALEG